MESWKKVIDTNVRSAFILTELLYPKMENSGSIINMGSIQFGMTAPGSVLYTSAKGALYGMTISYAVELGKRNIRVNMISPGNVNTPRNLAQYEESIGIVKGYEGKTPLGRSVESEEVSDLVLFLLSDRSKAITGQNYIIDCGHTVSLWDPVWDRKA